MTGGVPVRETSSSDKSPHMSFTNIINFISNQLNGDNYLVWKHQMVTILKTLGLLKYVDLQIPQPRESSSKFEARTKANGYVSTCINATLDPSIAHVAIGIDSTATLWKELEELYLQQAFAKRSQF